MAQVEIIMYVALGFGVATLVALLLGRVLWSLAVAVGRRRAQRTSPTPAVAELRAERDRLRAENAMLARKVEVRLDDLKTQVAEHMAEVSRSRNRVDRLSAEVAERDAKLAERDSEIARLKEQVAALLSELETRGEVLRELQEEHGKVGEANAAMRQELAERDRHIEQLRADVERLGAARSEAVSRERTVQERLKGRIEDLSALSRQIEAQRRELAAQQSQSQALRDTLDSEEAPDEPVTDRIEDAERQASELQSELDRLDEMWAAKLADVAHAVSSEPVAPDTADKPRTPEPDEAAMVNGGVGKPVTSHAVEIPPQDEMAEADDDDKKSGPGLANVISLAQRIRALQRNGP
jgi:chromosome segregation ATPase